MLNKEERARALMLECIQNLQQHPGLEPSSYRSYVSIIYGASLKKCGMTVEQVCAEWEGRTRRRYAPVFGTRAGAD